MSSSTDLTGPQPVTTQPGTTEPVVTPVRPRDLRVGTWTRLGPASALGDAVSERTLAGVAEQARAAAQAQGYSVGWAQGRQEAAAAARVAADAIAQQVAAEEERREAEHRDAVAALTSAAEQLRQTLTQSTEQIERQGTELAWALTEELVGHEVRGAETPDVVRRVLDLAPHGETVSLHLHPIHLAHPSLAQLKEHGVSCVPDVSLAPLDAVVHVDDHAYDLRISTAMNRVREVLR